MNEEQGNNNILNRLPGWVKNPFVIVTTAIILAVIIYFLLPYFQTLDSPFTQYKPLPIDSTYIKLDTTDKSLEADTVTMELDTILDEPTVEKTIPSDTSKISNLFRLNTDYEELDPNEQLMRNTEVKQDDIFSQLILAELEPSEVEELQSIDLNIGIKPILQLVTSTAVEILSGSATKFHMDVLKSVEQAPIVQGIIIIDRGEKIIYATNRKWVNQYLFKIFPGRNIIDDKLIIQKIDDLQFISMAVHHQYGKIGTVLLILND